MKVTGILGSAPLLPGVLSPFPGGATDGGSEGSVVPGDPQRSVIGRYGPWAASLADDPPKLSMRGGHGKDVEARRKAALAKTMELLSSPDIGGVPTVTVKARYTYDGLQVEELRWQLPYGRPTEAILLKPQGEKGPLPAILGLHDHGGNKYFGKRKITRTAEEQHPLIAQHQEDYYGGLAWANEMAREGYVVLVHDAYAFASRRVLYGDVSEIPWGHLKVAGKHDDNPEDPENIAAYNTWAAYHESEMAKSLFCAGTTWPGVFLAEDRKALDVLSARNDVDADRIGCAGLSGGGLRTVYLGGVDPRIRCAVCVGFMSTWKDFLLYKSYTHTWMTYTPLLPNYLDFPEILGLRAPLPAMVLNNDEDPLFTPEEMSRADTILRAVYDKAGAGDHYAGRFYSGGHKFDAPMQQDAIGWFDRWLKP